MSNNEHHQGKRSGLNVTPSGGEVCGNWPVATTQERLASPERPPRRDLRVCAAETPPCFPVLLGHRTRQHAGDGRCSARPSLEGRTSEEANPL